MKKYASFIIYSAIILFFASCRNNTVNSIEPMQEDTGILVAPYELHEVCRLDEYGAASPTLEMDISVLIVEADKPEVASNINRCVSYTLFEIEDENIAEVCDSFAENRRKEYMEQRAEYIDSREDAPWFNNTVNISCETAIGYRNCLNYIINSEEYTGGAHPNGAMTALNFDTATGAEIVLQDIFQGDYERRLMQELVIALAAYFKVEPVTDEVVKGFLINDLYVSNNFILGKESITFIYNRYDIAPYSTGEILLDIDYNRIKDILK